MIDRPAPPRKPLLTEKLSCPRCEREFVVGDLEKYRGFPECHRHGCEQRWWAMMLHAGSVRPQLGEVFGDELAPILVETFNLPEEVRQPLFWQISISDAQYQKYGRAGSGSLLRFLSALVPSASNR